MLRWTLILVLFCAGCASRSSQNKEKAELHLRLANAQMEAGAYPAALRELQKAEQLDPNNAVVQNNLGLVYFFRERYQDSENYLRKALRLNPEFSEARNNLARVLIENKKYDLAESEVKKVINDLTYPAPEKAYGNLGLIYFNQKKFSDARAAYSKVLGQIQDDCVAATYYGRTFFEEGDYKSASEYLDRAIGFCQKNLDDEPHYYSALAYYRSGDKSKSIARFQEILKLYPSGKYREKATGMLSLLRKDRP